MARVIALLALAGAIALAGCGFPHTPQERAQWFFGQGEEWILDALDDEDASDEQMEAARAVLDRHREAVEGDVATFFERHHDVLIGLAGGGDTATLLDLESGLHDAHRRALTAIGGMHEELARAVGPETWEAASVRMGERARERLER